MSPNIKSLEKVKKLGGSTGADLLKDKSNGDLFVLKRGNSEAHATEEYVANKMYEALGVDVPKTYLYKCKDGDLFLLHEYIESDANINDSMDEALAKRVTKNFVADALLSNWDAYKNDNILIGSNDNKLYRIDNGGALRFRAQGGAKGSAFGGEVGELETLKTNNPYISSFLTEADIQAQIDDVLSKKEEVLAVAKDEELKTIMEERFNYLEGMKKYAKGGTVSASRTAMEIGALTGMNKNAIQDFVDANNLDIERLYDFVKKSSLPQRMDLVTAIVGKSNNTYQNRIIKDFSKGSGKMAMGGSLEGHGLRTGDVILQESGFVVKVLDKDGRPMFVNLADGYRGKEEPLPFAKGGALSKQEELNAKVSSDDFMDTFRRRKSIVRSNHGKKVQERWEETVRGKIGSGKNYAHGGKVERLAEGIAHELEHTSDLKVAAKIALDHLKETPDYYTRLKKAMLKKGGEVILEDGDEGKKFDANKYPAILKDFDGDGIPNIDDKFPLVADKYESLEDAETVEQVRFAKVFNKLLEEKKKMQPKMYNLVGKLKGDVPSGSTIYFRTKTPYSILNKLVDKRMTDPNKGLTDMIGTMVVVKDRKELDALNKRIKAGEFGKILDSDDYYKSPKGGYRAYHYIIMTDGSPAELQIKTKRQKLLNESSHEPYKQKQLNSKRLGELSLMADKADRGIKTAIKEFDKITSNSKALKKELTLKK